MNPFPWPTSPEPLRRLLLANLTAAAEPPTDQQVEALIRIDHFVAAKTKWANFLAHAAPNGPAPSDFTPDFLAARVMQPSGAFGSKGAIGNFRAMCQANALVPHGFETRVVALLQD